MIRTAEDYAKGIREATMEREREHLVQDLLEYCRRLEQEIVNQIVARMHPKREESAQ